MKLTQDELLAILKLFEASSFSLLNLETEDLKLRVSKGGPPRQGEPAPAAGGAEETQAPPPAGSIPAARPAVPDSPVVETGTAAVAREGLLEIRAPMLGIFYRSPEPGAPPYVEVGTFVKEDDSVALIEVMKVFNSVKAGVRGQVVEVCAENGHLVEYGQVLFLVKPVDAAEGKHA